MYGLTQHAIVIDTATSIENSAPIYTGPSVNHRASEHDGAFTNNGVATDASIRVNQRRQASTRSAQLNQLDMTNTVIADSNQHPIKVGQPAHKGCRIAHNRPNAIILKIRPCVIEKLDRLPTKALGGISNYLAVTTSA